MSARSYLSIGDVLTLLRQEFPDITISKIRFLESQGLVNPERTPSGYRKFYEHDVERLRWVLRQQREHFLPLKVIKDRLDDSATAGGTDDSSATATKRGTKTVARDEPDTSPVDVERDADPVLVGQRARSEARSEPVAAHPAGDASLSLVGDGTALPGIGSVDASSGPDSDTASATRGSAASPGSTRGTSTSHRRAPDRSPLLELVDDGSTGRGRGAAKDPANGRGEAPVGVTTTGPAATGPATGVASAGTSSTGSASRRSRTPSPAAGAGTSGEIPGPDPVGGDAATPSARTAPSAKATGRSTGKASDPAVTDGPSPRSAGASFSAEEVCATSGLDLEVLRQLQEFGLVTAGTVAGVDHFDDDAMIVATVTARLSRFGIEPRHLRLYKNAADREAGFVEQIVLPLVRQRNPEARARAHETAEELTQLGQQLRSSLLRSALGGLLDG
ncbi:MAG TPA: MerR family transcriptional regulator [Acidimicrobiales bacterium]|jgi:DNA-binding transcriptional MerR regulator|nr:MerR family transcriptional regulator [Acidimicrobiales bacterium]